jgi:S1-C subfamily serine protease
MKSKWIAAALVLGAVYPAQAEGQEPRQRVRAESPRAFSFAFNRGRIGVVVQTNDDREADKIGARVEAVSPGAPAEKAGLKAGDVITRFNGVSLAKNADDDTNPGTKLVRLAQALDPGDTVRLEYRRGDDTRTASLVAEDVDVQWSMEGPRGRRSGEFMFPPDIRLDLDEDIPGFAYMFGRPWGRLEMVNLNPDLGEYFGATEGVLVVRAPEEESLPLKGGDVILAIDERKPTSPAHAMRILRSYAEGETVKIEVMRKQKRSTVTWTVPEREERLEQMRRLEPRRRRSSEGRT